MIKAKEKIVWRQKKELLVILNTESGHYYTLNETAQDLWMAHVVEGEKLDTVLGQIAGKYDDPPSLETIGEQCRSLIQEWQENGLVEAAE